MESLAGYGSDEEQDYDRVRSHKSSVRPGHTGQPRTDDTNYDDVTMDMSEDTESEPELPPAEPQPRDSQPHQLHAHRKSEGDRRNSSERDRRERERRSGERDRERRRESPSRSHRDRRSPLRDDKYKRDFEARKGTTGDRGAPALDCRDTASPRFTDRDRRPKDSDREKHSRRDEHSRKTDDHPRKTDDHPRKTDDHPRKTDDHGRKDRTDEHRGKTDFTRKEEFGRRDDFRSSGRRDRGTRSRSRSHERRTSREKSRSRSDHPHEPQTSGSAFERRGEMTSQAPSTGPADYRPTSYKVNKKLQVMEKMGLQIKTPDGSMTTAQQLRSAAEAPALPAAPGQPAAFYSRGGVNATRILEQVQKRKALWAHKGKEGEAKWTAASFAADQDGKQANKFMRLMGIKEPGAGTSGAAEEKVDPVKRQQEMFEAMQAQYDVARITTHTMRGVGLGFQKY